MLWLKVFFVICSCFSSRAEVTVDSDGGFTNLVVGINPDVPEDKIRTVLSELEVLFENASSFLHEATRGQTFFKEVVFAVPKRYRTVLPDMQWTAETGCFKKPDVLLTSEDAFKEPYALQHKGCGKPGLRIHVPDAFLYGKSANKAKSLVREWAKYRYGVFEESGFVGDELYPACFTVPGSDTVKVTDCTSEEATYDIGKSPGESSMQCNPVPRKGRNKGIVSSIMNKMDFSGVTQFCDDKTYPHDRNAPSKQNTLCRKQSTWKVISQHSDFKMKGRKRSRENLGVTFKYVIEPNVRLILAVDTSNKMNENDRWDMVQNAFAYFALYTLPENSMVGLKDLKNRDKSPVLVTVNTPADAEILIDAFPETGGQGDVCVQCGILEALQALKGSSDGAPRGQIVVVSSSDIPESSLGDLEEKLTGSDVSLHVLYFDKRLRQPPLLQKLCAVSWGGFHYVPDTEGALNVLYEAFRSIYEAVSWLNRNHVLVTQRAYSIHSCSTCNLTFQSDQSMENFQVLLTGPRFIDGPPVVKDKTVLSNGNQEFAPGHSSYSYKRKIPAYVFTIKNPKPGSWSLSFERKPGFDKSLVVIVRSSTSRYNGLAHMSSWIAYEDNAQGSTFQKPPVAFFSEVKMKHFPLSDVSVSAILYKEDLVDEVRLDLLDVGDGDPDITKSDGIFSKYFTESTQSGYYLVTMVAESKNPADELQNSTQSEAEERCCGSAYPPSTTFKMAPFQRVVSLGSFYLPPEVVALPFPPRRISDLRVRAVATLKPHSEVVYELVWTSPGSNYDSGTVSDYQLRVFRNPRDAEEHFDSEFVLKVDDFNIHGQMLTRDTAAGTTQRAMVELSNLSSGTYHFAMRTQNAEERFSQVSNVVEIWYDTPPPPSTLHPPTDEDGSTIPNNPTPESDHPLSMASGLGLALGLTFGILLFLVLVGCILCLYCRRYRKQEKEEQTLNDMSQKSESRDVLCNSSSHGLNVSVISPVHSWPADSLLSHYESVKKDKNSEDDTMSVASSKYSYVHRAEQNASVYDAVYFQKRDDGMNYPFNPGYGPFNPMYTSSLRKIQDERNGCSPLNSSVLDSRSVLDCRGSLNPVFTSSLPRPRAVDRILSESSPSNNTSFSSYTLDSRGTLRLGTDV